MVQKSPTVTPDSPLLTKAAKLDQFTALFGGKLSQPGTLFLPNSSFYNKLATDAGLSAAARELYKWLGVKPRRIAISYGDTPQDGKLCIPEHYRELPYQSGALLVLYVVRDAIDHLGYAADQSFVELATLESGLGILVVNGLYPPHRAWEGLIHSLRGQWHMHEMVITHAYHPNNYASELLSYAESQQLSQRLWAGHLHAEARRRMGLVVRPAHRELLPVHEAARRNQAKTTLVRIILFAILGAILVITATYVAAQRPKRPGKLATEQYQEVVLRKQAYDACAQKVKQLAQGSESNDIFADQDLNAEKSRCLSLQNTYNAAVSRYNDTLSK